ncbi:SusE domain-containing protein [Terrimonas pollutisoli]|uniref:SusE domain-containing protein n=1 Tax=Terrimonas pollutisoli TaxID=3034147 RepID=UPI0023EDCF52|nr:SusE domain-containing protein [Terrimonas sp. H1YJ31]
MKNIINKIMIVIAGLTIFSACHKVDDLPFYSEGKAVTLTASKNAVVASPADSAKGVVAFSWTSPGYATDSTTYKFNIEIDSAGRNFSKKIIRTVTGKLSDTLKGKELNAILLDYGFALGVPYDMDIRVVSSYSNNNEQYVSNVVKLAVTPYNDPSVLTTEKTSVTPAIVTATQHSNKFSWTPSFNGYTGTINYVLQYDSATKNFAAPQEIAIGSSVYSKSLTEAEMNETALKAGIVGGSLGKIEYRIKATTVQGAVSYSNAVSVTIASYVPVPANLFIVGDATPGGWSNPVPTPSQQFTKVDDYSFSITIGLTAGKSYLFLPVNGSWDHKYGGSTDGVSTAGELLKDGAVPGSNTPAPATSGVYKIVVNFQTSKYTVTQIPVPSNLYIVGDATPGGWSNPVSVPSQQFTPIDNVSYGIVINLTAGKSYLFLPVNGSWDHKYGGTSATGGALLADGAVPGSNTPAPATDGLYKIVVNFATNTYSVTPYDGPSSLYIVGDATAGGWSNPVPVPSQQFTQTGNASFKITIPLTAGKSYLLLPVNGSWDHKYGGTSSTEGTLLADGDVPGSNTPAPSQDGTYEINVNFITMQYSVVKQ